MSLPKTKKTTINMKIALPHLTLTRKVLRTFTFAGLTFCLHKTLPIYARSGYKYGVSELGSGMKVSVGTSKDRAVSNTLDKLKRKINEYPDDFHQVIKSYPQIN